MRQVSLALILVLGLFVYVSEVGVYAPLSPPTQLTFNTRNDRQPAISSDGSRIAFSSELNSDVDIFTMNSDGTNLLPVASSNSNETSPSISANGGKVAFESAAANDADIFIVNSDGTGLLRLTGSRPLWGNLDETNPAISGDGLWVAFESNDDPLHLNPEGDTEVFLIRTDGTGLRQLTVNTREDVDPSISAGGGRVAFQTNVGTWEIFAVNSDGTGLTQLSNNQGATSPSFSVSISADGSKVAYDSAALAPASSRELMRVAQGTLSRQVYVVNSNGAGQPIPVSATAGDNFTPSLSGDGAKVAYVSTGDGDREIFMVNSTGAGGTVRVTDNAVFDVEPSLDYSGARVVFSSNLGGDFEIFVQIMPTVVRDVAVTLVDAPRRIGYNAIQSNPLQVRVTVENHGTVVESLTVEFSFLNGPVLSTQTVNLAPSGSATLTFEVSIQPLARGQYTLVARAIPVPGEINVSDNVFQDGIIEVRHPGDVDGNGRVEFLDLAILAFSYGKSCGTAGYLYQADFENDCDVDFVDLAVLAFYYGTTG